MKGLKVRQERWVVKSNRTGKIVWIFPPEQVDRPIVDEVFLALINASEETSSDAFRIEREVIERKLTRWQTIKVYITFPYRFFQAIWTLRKILRETTEKGGK